MKTPAAPAITVESRLRLAGSTYRRGALRHHDGRRRHWSGCSIFVQHSVRRGTIPHGQSYAAGGRPKGNELGTPPLTAGPACSRRADQRGAGGGSGAAYDFRLDLRVGLPMGLPEPPEGR
ncbi:MAG: hypothetical protein IPH64_17970 [Comamonadaceae bacterium]|nr:hypothetical protein [Comamonadaceae bacterium]